MNISLAEVKLPEIDATRLKRSKDEWVEYGAKNDFPDYLIQLEKKVTTHGSFIEKRQELIKSEGLTYSDDIAGFIEAINEELETADDLLDQVAADLATLETFAVMVRYNKLKDKIVALDYVDSSKVRPHKVLDERGRIQGYWVCADWSNVRENIPVYFEKFNPGKIGKTTQLYFYSRTALGQPFLPKVSYAAALNYMELSYELSKFGLNTVINGFFSSGILKVKATMNDDQKYVFTNKVKESFTGSENASKLMVTVSEETDSITFTPLNTTDNTPLLKALRDMCTEEICSAHRGNPIVAAIQASGSTLGSDGKLYRDSLEIYYNTVIRQLQKPFIAFMEKVLTFNGFTDFELEITSSAMLSNSLDMATKADFIKPEVWLAEYGYTKEDIKSELLDAAGDVVDPQNAPEDPNALPDDTDETPEV